MDGNNILNFSKNRYITLTSKLQLIDTQCLTWSDVCAHEDNPFNNAILLICLYAAGRVLTLWLFWRQFTERIINDSFRFYHAVMTATNIILMTAAGLTVTVADISLTFVDRFSTLESVHIEKREGYWSFIRWTHNRHRLQPRQCGRRPKPNI